MGILTVEDLLLYFPRTYELHNQSNSISDLRTDQINTIEAKVLSMNSHLSQRTGKWIYKAHLEDDKGYELEAVWFAKPYQLTGFKEGTKRKFIGKVKYDFGVFSLQSPKIESVSETLHSRLIVPVYPQTEKITSSWLMEKIRTLLYLTHEFPEVLPESMIHEEKLMERSKAIQQVHLPESEEILVRAKERLAFEELYIIHRDAILRKQEFQANAEKFDIAIPMNTELVKSFFESLPFTPTNSQKIAIFEILKDMEKQVPMSRLLEGDVGSGKTLVAATAAICAINAGFQVAIMAPTEVLARQHFESFVKMYEKFSSVSQAFMDSTPSPLTNSSFTTTPSPLTPLPEGEGDKKDSFKKEFTEKIFLESWKETAKMPEYILELARELRQNQTPNEEILWECLRDRKLFNCKFRRQQPIGRYIADFYCHEARLVVEIDGGVHNTKDQKEYDSIRDEVMNGLDLKILRISNSAFNNIGEVLAKIASFLPPSPSGRRAGGEGGIAMGELKKTGITKPISVALLLGSQKKQEKQASLLGILNGTVDIIVGTHALIQEQVAFHKLGLIVIDEQHRFGVEQRKKLGENGNPHTLNMTATPIPRTLALVAYGDQDLSALTEMPPGRKEIITRVVGQMGRREISLFIDTEFEKGRQAYVICPLIEESKAEIMAEVKSVLDEAERLKEMFPHRRIGIMHGKLKSDEKELVMKKFKNKEYDILVSTSVVEVGVDVPNATIMIIEGAERFGLSQLHQFRGRVGRGEDQSYCFLFPSKESGKENERLQAMEQYADGFRLAEIDMRLRGPGEVYGVRQSGIPDLKMAQLTDQKFVLRVRQATEKAMSS